MLMFIPRTETYDQMGELGMDSRWDKFANFHQYLSQVFPQVYVSLLYTQAIHVRTELMVSSSHQTLQLTNINTYALLYVWEGTDRSLKPLLLNAHQGEQPETSDLSDPRLTSSCGVTLS